MAQEPGTSTIATSAEWSCIYRRAEDGNVYLFAFVGDAPEGAQRIEDFPGKIPRYESAELAGTKYEHFFHLA